MKNINRNCQRRSLLVALCALFVIPATPLAAQSRPEEARQQLKGHLTPEMEEAPLGARLTPTTQLTFTVGLVIPKTAKLNELASQIADPNSPLYRKYLTPEQFADRFGATPDDYQSVLNWAQSNNLTATTHRNRFVVTVTGAVADIESALNVHLHYRSRADGTQFFSPDVEPSLKLSVPVEHIGGLNDFYRPESASGSGSGGSYQGTDFRNAYAPNITLTGKGQTIGIFMFNAFTQSDIDGYASQTGQTFLPVKVVPAGATLNPGTEGTLDVEAALSMAPAAQIVGFVGTSSDPTSMLTNMTDHTEINQFSSSWFWYDGTTTDTNLMQQLATQGQSFFQASGDGAAYVVGVFPTYTSGSLDCRQFPAITLVGGTVLNMSGPGTSYGTLETAWPSSSGGIEASVPIPSYQLGIAGVNGASTTNRNVPDVSTQGSDILIYYEGSAQDVNGTSLATPLWAGYMALVNELAAKSSADSVGFANPALYSIASGSDYDTNFHDIVSGCTPDKSGNKYCSGTGYDLTTGLGSPKNTLIYTLSGVHPQIVSYTPDGGPAAGGTKVTINGAGFAGLEKVTFGGVAATHVAILSDTELTAVSPVAPDSDTTIEVVSPGGKATAAALYAYYPEIDGVSPKTGPVDGGIPVTVTGLALGNAAIFEFGVSGGAPATKVKCSSSKSCTMVAPAHALGTVDIIAITPWGYGNSPANSKDKFTYQSPTITSFTPTVGATTGGVSVSITGVDFQSGKTTFSFDGVPGTSVYCSGSTFCSVTSPAHAAGPVHLTATVAGSTGPLSSSVFTYVVYPTITAISPSTIPINTGSAPVTVTLTITGTGFSTAPGATVFNYGATSPLSGVSCSSATKCTASFVNTAFSSYARVTTTAASVTVTVNGLTSLDSVAFNYPAALPPIPPCKGTGCS